MSGFTKAPRDDHETEAAEQLISRLDDLRRFVELEDAFESDDPELGNVFDYGLEWVKDSISFADGTITYRHVISTGGPHEQFDVTFDLDSEVATAVTFVSLPWFDRVEIELEGHDLVAAKDFYTTFYAGSVSADACCQSCGHEIL